MKSFKVTVPRKVLYDYRRALSQCLNIETELYDLTEAIDESLENVEAKIKKIERVKEPSKEVKAFSKSCEDLFLKYAELGHDGNPKRFPNNQGGFNYNLQEDKVIQYEEELASLEQSHKEVLQAQRKKEDGFNKALENDIELELVSVDKNWLRSIVKLTPAVRKILRSILVENKGE